MELHGIANAHVGVDKLRTDHRKKSGFRKREEGRGGAFSSVSAISFLTASHTAEKSTLQPATLAALLADAIAIVKMTMASRSFDDL